MKLSKFVSLLLVALIAMVAASGCKKKPVGITPIRGGMTGSNPSDPNAGQPLDATQGQGVDQKPVDGGIAQVNPDEFEKWTKDAEIFKEDMVFFAYDSSVVRASEKSKVAKIADYMKAHPENALEVDGHCDERGTEEYNRALGERRALAVREELATLGANASRIVTKSFGKDRPLVPLASEAAWSKNRRAEFILLTQPK